MTKKIFMPLLRSLTLLVMLMAISPGNTLAAEINIVCFGTSFTYGKGVFRGDAWPAKLEAGLKKEGLREVEWVILDHFRGLATCK